MENREIQGFKEELLQRFWGYESFRDFQSEIIDEILSGRDVVALLPTGGGKSLCYQLPALLLPGLCLVISPLLALMKDQVQQLQARGLPAAYLSSELEDFQVDEVMAKCQKGLVKMLYISPERLRNKLFLNHLANVSLSFLAVDEAHCISEWGQDFRPGYGNIAPFREEYAKLPVMALTGTATPRVEQDIISRLHLRAPAIFRQSFRRENLSLILAEMANKIPFLISYLKEAQGTGLIYVRTRREAETVADLLRPQLTNTVEFFHAGLHLSSKNSRMQKWLSGEIQVLVTTNAFGMGIDKKDVRFIIHFSPPQSLENYYQEIGRAGRDGYPSAGVLLWNEQDLLRQDQLFKSQIPSKAEFAKTVRAVYGLCGIADGDYDLEPKILSPEKISRVTGIGLPKVKAILNYLHIQGWIQAGKGFAGSAIKVEILPEEMENLPAAEAYFLELLLRTVEGIHGRYVNFQEKALAEKLQVPPQILNKKLRELAARKIITYRDALDSTVQFVQPRRDDLAERSMWQHFAEGQKNKIEKWESVKNFVQHQQGCRMLDILHYFGEKGEKPCGKCSVCAQGAAPASAIKQAILEYLRQKPATLDQIGLHLIYYSREEVLENLIELREARAITMQDYRTYRVV